ncbi:MAG: helix-turn-helix domain-containing protein [Desulfovibrio sp.]|nr:helix-turn-helix domain-containing protein [Desulfovibrio sp.]
MRKNWKIDKSLETLGHNVRTARIKRRLMQSLVAERAGISAKTLQKIEAGNPGVSIRAVAGVLFALGFGTPLESLCAPATDEIGMLLEEQRLPSRVRRRSGDF